ncbi:MAG: TetR/AcrR family transcriptional regulator [Anaerolineales bacterium]|nr:TetR/AcrR family transcriptional regulator [Anaerolineales bacterium]MCA9931612.1 TetR/AcrR family transcriptional regulator [Anaerolineales bacterium]
MTEIQLNNRRERRIAARKLQILDAAAHVFSRQGYARATTREIAEIADVSEGTLYNYFGSKRELLIGVAKAYADKMAAEIACIESNDFGDMLAAFMANRFRTGRERRLFMLFLYESRHNVDVHQYYVQEAMHRIIEETERRISILVTEGRMREIDPAIAARTLSATIMGFAALFELGVPIEQGSPEKLGKQITDIFLNGMRNLNEV